LDDISKKHIIDLRNRNYTIKSISNIYQISERTVFYIIKRNNINGNIDRKVGTGKKKVYDIDEIIKKLLNADNNLTINQIIALIKINDNIICSHSNVHKRLKIMGYISKVPIVKSLITEKHLNDREYWAIFYTNHNWNNVIWSDESTISIQPNKYSKLWIYKNDTIIKRSVKHPLKLHVWGCILKNNNLIVHIYDKTMDSKKYVDILTLKLLPLMYDHYKKTSIKPLFQQDNAPCHTSKVCLEYFSNNNIEVMFWPANSPDLNPIENVWNILKKKIGRVFIKNKGDLINIINKTVNEFNINTINNIINSMDNRIDALFKNSFDSINY